MAPIADRLEAITIDAIEAIRAWESTDETNPLFVRPFFIGENFNSENFAEETYQRVTSAARQASELVAERLAISFCDLPKVDAENWKPNNSTEEDAARIFSYLVGVSFSRWNGGFSPVDCSDEATNPFDPLPLTPPGAVTASQSAPNCAEERSDNFQRIGCLTDHERGQLSNFSATVRSNLIRIWGNRAEEVESALCRNLRAQDIESYIDKPNGFFAGHLKRYSSNRRKAPIYWPLSTTSGSYTIWVYSPSLTSQTLYTAINDFVEPKLKQVGADVTALRNKGSARVRDDEKQFESLQSFELELIELRDTLRKLAPTYKPNHDDGVQITAAPLWPLFRHKPWQKVLKDTWGKLEKGDYDWAHLAHELLAGACA